MERYPTPNSLSETLDEVGCEFGRETRESLKYLEREVAIIQDRYSFILETLKGLLNEVKELAEENENLKGKLLMIVGFLTLIGSFLGTIIAKLIH